MSRERQVQLDADGHRLDVWKDESGVPRCNAKLRGKDARCRQMPMRGSKRCRLHGGLAPKGPASPQWKDGSRSSWRDALGVSARPRGDQSYLDLREGIDAQQVVLAKVAERLAENDSPAFREQCRKRMALVKKALAQGNADDLARAIRDLDRWIASGRREDNVLKQMSDVAARLSSQVEGAHRARTNAVNAMNRADAVSVMAQLVAIIQTEVGADVAQRVLTRLDREVLGGRLAGDAAAAGEEGAGRVIEAEGGT